MADLETLFKALETANNAYAQPNEREHALQVPLHVNLDSKLKMCLSAKEDPQAAVLGFRLLRGQYSEIVRYFGSRYLVFLY